MALLNKPRLKSKGAMVRGRYEETPHISSLVIVPHRDLAYQLLHWIQRITDCADIKSPISISSVAQVLVREGSSHLTTGLSTLRQVTPHILIGTPNAIMDVYRESPDALQLPYLSTVAVDEVDYLIETAPKKDPKRSFFKAVQKAKRKLLAHPGVTRELLDIIYAQRKEANDHQWDEPGLAQHRRRTGLDSSDSSQSPQLVLSSATLRSHLSEFIFEESGWLNRDNMLRVKGASKVRETPKQGSLDGTVPFVRAREGLGGTGITHSVLVVSDDGIYNVAGAVSAKQDADNETVGAPITPEAIFSSDEIPSAPPMDQKLAESESMSSLAPHPALTRKIEYAKTPSPFNPNAFEAIATAFALDVPSVALLVLPSSAPVQRAVYELLELGVNARGLDLLDDDKGRSHLLNGAGIVQDNPTLLVATLATTRGLDLPELTHVFLLGIPEGPKVNGRTVDAYLHIAGRVGRFGRGGKVITVVEKGTEVEEVDEEHKGDNRRRLSMPVSEESKMLRILRTIAVTPVRFEHFD